MGCWNWAGPSRANTPQTLDAPIVNNLDSRDAIETGRHFPQDAHRPVWGRAMSDFRDEKNGRYTRSGEGVAIRKPPCLFSDQDVVQIANLAAMLIRNDHLCRRSLTWCAKVVLELIEERRLLLKFSRRACRLTERQALSRLSRDELEVHPVKGVNGTILTRTSNDPVNKERA